MPEQKRLLFLHAFTALHPGSGTALGVVDLPVQRERHTQWPLIPGSSLKGVLRDQCRLNHGDDDKAVTELFGPPAGEDAHAGAITVTDAFLVAFPVRSLKGLFAWATCAAVLERLNRALKLVGKPGLPSVSGALLDGEALVPKESPLKVEGGTLVLEEFDFRVLPSDGSALASALAELAVEDPAARERLKGRLAVLSDDDFTHFSRHATEVTARIGLDPKTKTARDGALFYQEFLPAECLFAASVFVKDSRAKDGRPGGELWEVLLRCTPEVLQVGGDETTGKGLCVPKWVQP